MKGSLQYGAIFFIKFIAQHLERVLGYSVHEFFRYEENFAPKNIDSVSS